MVTQLQLFIRLPEVRQKVGMSKSHIYNLMGSGDFPAQIKLSQKRSVNTLKNTPRNTASEYAQIKKLEPPVPILAKKISMTSTDMECQKEA